MSTSPNSFKLPTAVKVALVLACCAGFFIISGPAAVVWVVLVIGGALVWMYHTWLYLLLALTASFALGCWIGHANQKGRLRVGLQLISYTFLSGCAVYLIISMCTISRIHH